MKRGKNSSDEEETHFVKKQKLHDEEGDEGKEVYIHPTELLLAKLEDENEPLEEKTTKGFFHTKLNSVGFICWKCDVRYRNELAYRCVMCNDLLICRDCQVTGDLDHSEVFSKNMIGHKSTHYVKLVHIKQTSEEEEVEEEVEEEAKEEEKKDEELNEPTELLPRKTFPYMDTPFASLYLDDVTCGGYPPMTVIEQQMNALSAVIREKERWFEKYKDEEISKKWREEAKRQLLSDRQIDYVFKELDYYHSIRKDGIEMSAVEGVWQADRIIDDDLKQKLLKEISVLEDVPDNLKDWHPNTNKQVLDLVHPSLFCLYNNRSKVLPYEDVLDEPFASFNCMGAGDPVIFQDNTDKHFSQLFQWLPAEFDVSSEGKVKIFSYINNLHPKLHSGLYSTIERIFEKFIPLFERTLSDWLEPRQYRIANYSPNYQNKPPPQVPNYKVPAPYSSPISLRNRRLQVIVKIADTILTPSNPFYKGGSWHVEGMSNERIVATGIYYIQSENLLESRLRFRIPCYGCDYRQDDSVGVRRCFGLLRDGALNQNLGSVITKSDRLITFPNVFQHQVAPFELDDLQQPGHRKILVFFLVDPDHRVVSTLETPPQQRHWYVSILRDVIGGPFASLPDEILEMITSYLPDLIDLNTAKEYRLDLMLERGKFVKSQTQEFYERPFTMCEH